MKNKIHFLGKLFLSLTMISLFFKGIYSLALYLYNVSVSRADKSFLTKYIDLTDKEKELMNKDKYNVSLNLWKNNTPSRFYNILSYDNIALYGKVYIQENFSNKTVIIVHGYCGSGDVMNYAAKKFYENGFNVVLPDCRGHGHSEGNYIGMGWHDRKDVITWCEKIIKANQNAEIILYGISMGAATVMMASGENLPKNIKCVIEDCGYTSVYDEFKYQLKNIYKFIPTFPILDIVGLLCNFKAGYSFRKASALKQIKKCKIPILFIHGGDDKFVPTEMVYKLFSNAKCKKDIMIIENAGHGVAAMIDNKKYWNKVFNFIKENI